MDKREAYESFAMVGVDPKGRVGIPASMRHALEKNGDGRTIHIAAHPVLPCLIGSDAGWDEARTAQLLRDEQAATDRGEVFDRDNVYRGAFALKDIVAYDQQTGRFVLGSFFRQEIAGLADNAIFLGKHDHFEIWNPETLAVSELVSERTRMLARHCLANPRGGKKAGA